MKLCPSFNSFWFSLKKNNKKNNKTKQEKRTKKYKYNHFDSKILNNSDTFTFLKSYQIKHWHEEMITLVNKEIVASTKIPVFA